jgi:(p)ppGpp synthase/HD superfamily hydrolase
MNTAESPLTPSPAQAHLLGKAIAIAAQAHQGQLDKFGAPYILHPIRLMMQMDSYEEKMAAILHDVVEDTDWTLEALKAEGFPQTVVDAVDGLTHRAAESYTAYVKRAKTNPIACKVKLADLEDNMDARRVPQIGEREIQRLKRYHRHWLMLQQEEDQT